MDIEEFTKPVYINIYNFEDQRFQDNRYVLTSPRSLQACDECNVKPADLLYKPLSEFQDELDGTLPFEQILERYNSREQRRLGKLSAVRRKRVEIIDADDTSGATPEPDVSVTFGAYDDSRSQTAAGFYADTERTRRAVIDNRGMKHSTLIRDDNENTICRKFMDLDISEVEKADSEKSEKSDTDCRRTRTMTPGSSHRSLSNRSMTSSHKSLTSWTDRELRSAGKIKDQRCRQLLHDGANLSITSHDQKIIAALIRKEEDDRRQEKLRRLAHIAWEESHDRARKRHEREAMERKMRLTDVNKTRAHIRTQKEVQREKEMEELTNMKRQRSVEKESRWERSIEKIHDKSIQQLVEKKKQEFERKKGQEKRRSAKETELDKYHKMVNQYQMAALEKAVQKKDEQLQKKTLRIAEKNLKEKEKQRERLSEVEKQKKVSEESMRSSIALKHLHADEKMESIENQRNKQIQEKKQVEEERLKNSRALVDHRDKVMSKYYSDLSQYQKTREEQAEEVHIQTIEKKRIRAAEDRVKRQELQKKNLNKVRQSEVAKARTTLDAIELKDIRSQRVQESKDIAAQQLRTLAYNSQLMRDQLRQHYGKDSFDKKCQKVELDVRLGLGGI